MKSVITALAMGLIAVTAIACESENVATRLVEVTREVPVEVTRIVEVAEREVTRVVEVIREVPVTRVVWATAPRVPSSSSSASTPSDNSKNSWSGSGDKLLGCVDIKRRMSYDFQGGGIAAWVSNSDGDGMIQQGEGYIPIGAPFGLPLGENCLQITNTGGASWTFTIR